jgi:hypothetical protein
MMLLHRLNSYSEGVWQTPTHSPSLKTSAVHGRYVPFRKSEKHFEDKFETSFPLFFIFSLLPTAPILPLPIATKPQQTSSPVSAYYPHSEKLLPWRTPSLFHMLPHPSSSATNFSSFPPFSFSFPIILSRHVGGSTEKGYQAHLHRLGH